MDRKPANAFIKTRKGFCYLTVKLFGRHHEMVRIRGYKIDPDEKRQMRRLYPEVAFGWKEITQQLAEKREDCRRYRMRTRRPADRRPRDDEPLFGIYEPGTRMVFTNGVPSTAAGAGRLLDAILQLDQGLAEALSRLEPVPTPSEPGLAAIQDGKLSKPA